MSEAKSNTQRSLVDKYVDRPGEGGVYVSPMVFSMESIRGILWRQKWILVGLTALVLLATFVVTLLVTPRYDAVATVRIDTSGIQVVEGQNVTDAYIHPSLLNAHMETLASILESRKMAFDVVDELELWDSEVLLGDVVAGPAPAGLSAEAWQLRRREMAANILRANVSAENVFETQVMAITFNSTDPVFAARIANQYVRQFLTVELDRTIEANSYAREFLNERIEEVRNRLSEAERDANEYARANRIIAGPLNISSESSDASAGTASTLTATTLQDINNRYTSARAERIEAEQRWRSVANVPALQIAAVQQDAMVRGLRSQIATLNAELVDLRQRYQDDYPEVRERASQVSSLTRELDTLAAQIKESIRSEYLVAQRQEAALASELSQASNLSLDEQDARVQFNLLDRQVNSLQAQLQSLLDRYNEIAVASNLRSNNLTLVDEAVTPGAPSSPNMARNLLLALVGGIALAVLFAILREVLDNRLRSFEDVEKKLGLHVLGQTPHIASDIDGQLDDNFSPVSEAYASIRASLTHAAEREGLKVFQFTSSFPGEGKSTSISTLASKFASVGKRVLLVDLDLRRPAQRRFWGISAKKSGDVVDVIYQRVDLASAVVKMDDLNLDILPVGQVPHNPVEILSSGLVAEFVETARSRYDIVLLDSSPVMGIADAPLLSRFADAVVFVIEANRANSRDAKVALRRLHDSDADIVGSILTKYRSLQAGDSYNYEYRYYTYSEEK